MLIATPLLDTGYGRDVHHGGGHVRCVRHPRQRLSVQPAAGVPGSGTVCDSLGSIFLLLLDFFLPACYSINHMVRTLFPA